LTNWPSLRTPESILFLLLVLIDPQSTGRSAMVINPLFYTRQGA